jgi:hypothetical protein
LPTVGGSGGHGIISTSTLYQDQQESPGIVVAILEDRVRVFAREIGEGGKTVKLNPHKYWKHRYPFLEVIIKWIEGTSSRLSFFNYMLQFLQSTVE